ncbi:MAG: cysteine protease [candidate division Zixibacteria bacterium HGW-Zixibacteria-1]|nr:MAG: cysteine protease [candidate division Zixibacteria bacterium HGW-Zixibacteria-1]
MLRYIKAKDSATDTVYYTGWLPPMYDFRDYHPEAEEIIKLTKTIKITPGIKAPAIPDKVDLRQWCSGVEDQEDLGSCSAHAAVGMVEYFENRAFGKHIEGSRLFVYKTTRNLMGVLGDTGAWLRTAMGALAHCGLPNERYWPYTTKLVANQPGERTFDDEPSQFVYAIADNYEALKYFCHDPLGKNIPKDKVLKTIKTFLAAKIPSMFGFFGYQSFGHSDVKGGVPIPCTGEWQIWGHAVLAVGYDDNLVIKNTICNKKSKGAFLFKNSWGASWGDKGYGWLPYEYVLNGDALDFWSLISMKWLETKNFNI